MSKVYDGMVVLEQPMMIETNVIYGLVYNTEKEYSEDETSYLKFYDRIDIYLAYMCALSRFLQERFLNIANHLNWDKVILTRIL